MAIVSTCPQCAKPVSLPVARPDARVRCPLCSGEFPLQSALDLAPPMLEVLETSAGVFHGHEVAAGNGVALAAPAMIAATTQHQDTDSEFTDEPDFGSPLTGDLEFGDELDTDLEGKSPSIDDLMADTEPPAVSDDLDFAEAPADDSHFAASHSLAENTAGETDEAEAPSFTAMPPGVSVAASALKRRQKEPSFIGNLIGVVGGGVVGCALAYFIVLWIGGPEKDFLELGKKLPKWMLPSAFNEPVAAVTPMTPHPTPEDLKEVKQAVKPEDQPSIKLNVPELPDKPAAGEDLTNATKLPFDTDPAKADDLAAELNADSGIGANPIEPPTKPADEDQSSEAPTPEQKPETVAVGFKEPVKYSAADLTGVLDEVNQLAAKVAEGKPAPADLKQYFLKLYRLGEVVTFAVKDDDDRQQVDALLAKLAGEPEKLKLIGKSGAGFFGLDRAKQGEGMGVLLAGAIESSEAVGTTHRIILMPVGATKPISIYSAVDPGLKVGTTVLVLGSIVDEPQAAMTEFAGDEAKIVWLGASTAVGN